MNDAVQINLTSQTRAKLEKPAQESGRNADDLVEDALVGYPDEVAQLREALDSRFDDLKSGRVKPIPADVALAQMRERSQVRRSKRHE